VRITGIDHIVLTVASVEASVDFYSRVLGMDVMTFGRGGTSRRRTATPIGWQDSLPWWANRFSGYLSFPVIPMETGKLETLYLGNVWES